MKVIYWFLIWYFILSVELYGDRKDMSGFNEYL